MIVGNDALGESVEEGSLIENINGVRGLLQYGTTNGVKSRVLGFITSGADSYLVAINGKLLEGCKNYDSTKEDI